MTGGYGTNLPSCEALGGAGASGGARMGLAPARGGQPLGEDEGAKTMSLNDASCGGKVTHRRPFRG
jgi:hypothetical protein